MKRILSLGLLGSLWMLACTLNAAPRPTGESIVFIHPDGAGLTGWNALRIHSVGPDGYTQWDLMPQVGFYRGHMKEHLGASSHGGGTIHAYGVKVPIDSYGMFGQEELTAASGAKASVMEEARDAGLNIGIINTGHLAEPGTGCMLASVTSRRNTTEIVSQLVASQAELILGGGEVFFLPEGVVGHHGEPGTRKDGRNLVEEARQAGYTVIFTREELLALSSDTEKVLGLFAARDTYNDEPEELLRTKGLPLYNPGQPSVAEMTEVALRWLTSRPEPFFLMVEEEGTDNFGNYMNAAGALEAFRRADEAIGVARRYVQGFPRLTLLTAADSEASGLEIVDMGLLEPGTNPETLPNLPPETESGAPVDGYDGTGTRPFVSAPDRFGQRHLFGIAWIGENDFFGGIVSRAEGSQAHRLPLNLDNTQIYTFLREVLLDGPPDQP